MVRAPPRFCYVHALACAFPLSSATFLWSVYPLASASIVRVPPRFCHVDALSALAALPAAQHFYGPCFCFYCPFAPLLLPRGRAFCLTLPSHACHANHASTFSSRPLHALFTLPSPRLPRKSRFYLFFTPSSRPLHATLPTPATQITSR
jgi:hypothetical protein